MLNSEITIFMSKKVIYFICSSAYILCYILHWLETIYQFDHLVNGLFECNNELEAGLEQF